MCGVSLVANSHGKAVAALIALSVAALALSEGESFSVGKSVNGLAGGTAEGEGYSIRHFTTSSDASGAGMRVAGGDYTANVGFFESPAFSASPTAPEEGDEISQTLLVNGWNLISIAVELS